MLFCDGVEQMFDDITSPSHPADLQQAAVSCDWSEVQVRSSEFRGRRATVSSEDNAPTRRSSTETSGPAAARWSVRSRCCSSSYRATKLLIETLRPPGGPTVKCHPAPGPQVYRAGSRLRGPTHKWTELWVLQETDERCPRASSTVKVTCYRDDQSVPDAPLTRVHAVSLTCRLQPCTEENTQASVMQQPRTNKQTNKQTNKIVDLGLFQGTTTDPEWTCSSILK
ncbi:unnamed protein product [Pleuronectes platessa]|uniref:Uncharacterized protein n=1 Tax=Pleuronectes platessa TaxID=8262 RepID=A0A9N7Y7E3_PLEPL|nr:unnamed protein product [Pleuronectes platessa]